MRHQRAAAIQAFILSNLRDDPDGIRSRAAKQFGITPQTVTRHMRRLVQSGLISPTTQRTGRAYELRATTQRNLREDITGSLEEDLVYQRAFGDVVKNLPPNVADLCHFGFTEMMNNAIDHSQGASVFARMTLTAADIEFILMDDGIGVFNSLLPQLDQADRIQAALEICKGKFTSDPDRHTGEGIFFTARCFDAFTLSCSGLTLTAGADRAWTIRETRLAPKDGTFVGMRIRLDTDRTLAGVFAAFDGPTDVISRGTVVPVNAARVGDTSLTSRSQARRLLNRLDRFNEVTLDFEGVPMIGQAFADEIFRVFAGANPGKQLLAMNLSESVGRMIFRVRQTPIASPKFSAAVDMARHYQPAGTANDR